MYPHISHFIGGDVVAEPFMPAFVDNDKIPIQSPSASREVSSPVSILKPIAISYRTLVFHAKVWRFHKLEAILIKRIRPEPMFKCLQHGLYLGKLFFGFVQVIIQDPIITVQFSFFTGI